MQCPACCTTLQMSERSGVEIDYCPSCRGVWLDHGELDKIIERSAELGQPQPPKQWGAPPLRSGHAPYFHKKRKRSFIEELFD